MLIYLLAIVAALCASTLTFFTGFGLGTVLLAAFVLIFPVSIAVAATAMVHMANNVFKLFLVWKNAKIEVIMRFGIPAMIAAFPGALLLSSVLSLPALLEYELCGRTLTVLPVKVIIGILMALFALVDLMGLSEKWVLEPKWMPAGGVLSGFFGGLSGHQGAFRTMFLLKSGLSKEQFVGTGALIAVLVDMSRLTVYWNQISTAKFDCQVFYLLAASTAAALLGSVVGSKILKKVTFRGIEITASVLLLVIALLLCAGLI